MKPISLRELKPQKNPELARERTLEAVKNFNEATDRIEKICRELKIRVPQLQ